MISRTFTGVCDEDFDLVSRCSRTGIERIVSIPLDCEFIDELVEGKRYTVKLFFPDNEIGLENSYLTKSCKEKMQPFYQFVYGYSKIWLLT